jgi:membrane associated rhomboid family serine protease
MWRTPWANYLLVALIVLVSILGFNDPEFFSRLVGIKVVKGVKEVEELGIVVPDTRITLTTENFPRPVLAIISAFLHVGWGHLIGNMLFLWVFGNAVNYKFRSLGFIGLYLASALMGGMVHYVFDGGPVVGASGAVNGAMGAFLVFFPRNDVKMLYLVGWWWGTWRLSRGWIILLWVAWDVLLLTTGMGAGIAMWSHVGGFATGFGIASICALAGWVRPTQDEQTLFQVLARAR